MLNGRSFRLLTDGMGCIPVPSLRWQGQAIFTFMSSLAGVASYFLGFLNLAELMPIFKDNQHALFYIGVVRCAQLPYSIVCLTFLS